MVLKIRKNKKSYTIADMYKTFSNTDVSYSRFKRILDSFNNYVIDCIFKDSKMFKMPYGLGSICIAKYKPKSYTSKSLSKDYKSSKEERKPIYYLNEHSNGYKYRLFWSKIPKTFPSRYIYQLQLVRENKRHLAQLIFNKQDYININDIQIYKM